MPRFGEPSALRVTEGVRVTKSAALANNPFAFVLLLFFHQTFVPDTSVPLVLSLEPPLNERLFVNICVPRSKAKLL
ncbi:hypothetical protein D3C80_2133270 [compost metagenome]